MALEDLVQQHLPRPCDPASLQSQAGGDAAINYNGSVGFVLPGWG